MVAFEGVKLAHRPQRLDPKQAHFAVALGAAHERPNVGVVVAVICHADNYDCGTRRAPRLFAALGRAKTATH